MSHDLDADTNQDELWQVAIGPNNVQQMTLEQLDAAYQAGAITEQTLVWTDGMDEWLPLSEVAGGSEAEAAPDSALDSSLDSAVAPPPSQQAAPTLAAAPAVTSQAPAVMAPGPTAAQIPTAQIPVQHPSQPAARQGAGFAPGGFAPGSFANSPSAAPRAGFGPGAFQPGAAPQASMPPGPMAGVHPSMPAGASFAPSALPSAPVSMAPVAMNLDSMDLDASFSKGKKSKVGVLAAAAVAIVGIGVTAMNLSGGESKAGPTAAAAAPVAAPLSKDDPNAPLDIKPTNGGYQVTEAEQKAFAKQAAKDKEMKELAIAAAAAAEKDGSKAAKQEKPALLKRPSGKVARKAEKSGSGSGLKAGGSAYDPLNSSLD